MKFFSLDSPLNKYGTILFDLIALTFLWLFTSALSLGILLPLATAGFINAVNKTIIEGNGYMLSGFFSAFSKKTLRNLAINFTVFVAISAMIFNLWAIMSGIIPYTFLLPIYIAVFFEIITISIYSLSLMMETDMKYKDVLKFGFILSNKHIGSSFLIFTVVIVATSLTLFINYFLIVLVTAPAHLLISLIIYKKVFSKYYLDKLVPEEE